MSDDELKEWCITIFATSESLDIDCEKCPYHAECNDFIERHEGKTPLFS